ncbi:heat-inducible transcriptional repressor HrcA [Candidatus Mycoplasma mahonii]|uniref:heat-inducible transcriptional repressor HrcA n=1 Tax=Candidatus Mycoplasma mahonii TaxID=3004105 RepID=UPI0026EAB559|nr:heat-inducible transcriptional repressor HrcA [Candidatus Mycoplasma mahonii]WKX02674.1 heat-inducible transcriptional repressor HrcA [Candidatus Mycoplasma mahonii]
MTNRQMEYLRLSIESYIEDGVPVASSRLINKYKLKISSATIRNELHTLEKDGFLEKTHTSSGRTPTIKGYENYAKNASSDIDRKMKEKLTDIFAKRRISIDATLDEAASAISEMASLTLVTSTSETEELLKSIQLTPLSDTKATVVIVTSTGRVESKLLSLDSKVDVQDVRIAIRLFKERLINTRLRDLSSKIELLAPILSKTVKNFEALIQTFIKNVFDFHTKIFNKVYGNGNLITSEGVKREDIAKLINTMEHKSVWSSIEGKMDEDENIKIDIRSNNTSIISKKIERDGISKEISIIGSNRMNYSDAKQAIKALTYILNGGKDD